MDIFLTGRVKVSVNGVVVCEGSNIVTTVGKELVATILASSATKPSHFGFGTGGSPIVAPADTQTALSGEFSGGWYARHNFATSRVGNVVSYKTQSGHWVNSSGGTLTLGEVGIFNASSSGTMLARFLTSTFTLATSAVVNVQWDLTVG